MATVESKLFTATDFWAWQQGLERDGRTFELDRGEIVEMPPPGQLHGIVCFLIVRLLGNFVFQRGKGYLCANDTGLLVETNPDTVRGPDIMLFDEQIPLERATSKFVQDVPKLVVEVLSPSDTVTNTNRRVNQLLMRGVPMVWLVDPLTQSVTVYPQGESHKVLDETDILLGGDALPDLRLPVADLFKLPGQLPQ